MVFSVVVVASNAVRAPMMVAPFFIMAKMFLRHVAVFDLKLMPSDPSLVFAIPLCLFIFQPTFRLGNVMPTFAICFTGGVLILSVSLRFGRSIEFSDHFNGDVIAVPVYQTNP